ncbi:MAG: hypothetical protein LIP01_00155 [Tannerellaceae bacterium]|nr:hypothetical protein [Tannerellaceae bacterium]
MNKYFSFCFIVLLSCNQGVVETDFSMHTALQGVNSTTGKPDNGEYLYVTAGNTLYSIGNQYGQFPEIGFHVPGEMGGVSGNILLNWQMVFV